ncbi:MAG: PIN domain-containing protein [Enterococcus sp.]|uniref:type II toxin-antitoxin system VapC family toxin n=1 Tax=Enterococcus sp. TaxID=35783 RepID=UPI00257FBCCD|nr:PIN domain-containing protein [Enterococcus sp.]MBR3046576.1 PIN domain-containing protein [Enterococcus sp.]
MRLMIDTNIILDVLLEREPLYSTSKQVLTMCEEKKIYGFISATTATDIFYLIRKSLNSTDEAYQALGHILDIVKVLTVTNEDVNTAFIQKARDFEDCLLATCAKSNKCDGIVTRNLKDFTTFDIKVFSPDEIIETINQRKES